MKHQYDYGRLASYPGSLKERGNEPGDKANGIGELPPVQRCNAFTLCLDAQTAISFLKTYGLDKDFKVSDLQITCFENLFLTLLERYYPPVNALVDSNNVTPPTCS